MNDQNFTVGFTTDKTPQQVYDAILNVRGWWSHDIDGDTDKLGDFHYRFKDIHRCHLRITELVPGKKVVWHVVKNYFSFTKDQQEWTGDDIIFEIKQNNGKTELKLTQVGLNPKQECYGACSDGWTTYITDSLKSLVETGVGNPNKGDAITNTEQELVK